MKRMLLLLLVAGAAYGDVGMSGGDSFETATTPGEGTFRVGASVGSNRYFYEMVDAGTLLSVGKTCESTNETMPLYNEAQQLLTLGESATSRWSASSEQQEYKIYFIVNVCQTSTWINVHSENTKDLNSGTDAGATFPTALRISALDNNNCCFLSLNTSRETGNDMEDTYVIATTGSSPITVDTLAPLEVTAYAENGTELATSTGSLSFSPQSPETYIKVNTTAAFSGGTNPRYSLILTGVTFEELTPSGGGTGGAQAQSGAAAAASTNGTRKQAKNGTTTESGQTGGQVNPETGETQEARGAVDTIKKAISDILKPKQEYAKDGPAGENAGKAAAGGSGINLKKIAALLIAAAAIFLVMRARKSP